MSSPGQSTSPSSAYQNDNHHHNYNTPEIAIMNHSHDDSCCSSSTNSGGKDMKKKKDKKTNKFSWQKAFGSASSSSSEQHDRRRQQELQQQRQDDSDHHEEEEENELLLSEQPSADTHHSGCSTSVDDRMVRFQKQALESIRTAFQMENLLRRTSSGGALTTSLPEDVVSLLHTFTSVLYDCFIIASKEVTTSVNDDSCKSDVCASNANDSNNKATTNDEVMVKYYIDGLLFVIRTIHDEHIKNRIVFVTGGTVEDTCAASNDFFRLSERMDLFLDDCILNAYQELLAKTIATSMLMQQLQKEWNQFTSILLQDAVCAAEYCQHFIMMDTIQKTTLPHDFFTLNWENVWTNNEPAQELIELVDNHLNVIQQYMCTNEYFYNKAIIATTKAIVCFYIRCLIMKADSVGRNERIRQRSMGLSLGHNGSAANNKDNNVMTAGEPFRNHRRGLLRMKDDISIITNFFRQKIDDSNGIIIGSSTNDNNNKSALVRIIMNEIWVLEVIHECLQTTTADLGDEVHCQQLKEKLKKKKKNHAEASSDNDESSSSSLESFILVLHKKTGCNPFVTRFFISDLWLLSDSQIHQRGIIRRTVNELQDDLQLVTTNMQDQQHQMKKSPCRRQNNVTSPIRKRLVSNKNHIATSGGNGTGTLAHSIPLPQLDEMLRSLYEDRLSQGILPLCWTAANICLPGVIIDANGTNDEDYQDHDIDVMLARKIQSITRHIVGIPKHIIQLPQKAAAAASNSHDRHKKKRQQKQADVLINKML